MRYLKKAGSEENFKSYAGCALQEVVQALLRQRGISDEVLASFLSPQADGLHDPFLFVNMERAVKRINLALAAEESLCVYGDYDCDGICAASILYLALTKLGAKVFVYIPDRVREGYGTNREAFQKIIAGGASLIIAVDCGIKSVEDVLYAKSQSADVIILDHHECGEILPDTEFIINPKAPFETYPDRELCGGALAFKLAAALLGREAFTYLDLAAVATIGDMVPLLGENRAIAVLGMEKLRKDPAPGLRYLAEVSKIDILTINARKIAFSLVPRINAAGRMAHGNDALKLLIERDERVCLALAKALHLLNIKRQAIQKEITQEAALLVRQQKDMVKARLLVARKKGWDKGVLGLAAASLAQTFNRPALVFSESEEGILTGSARSIPGINLYLLLQTCEDKYLSFGGHEMAAGLSLRAEDAEEVERRLNEAARKEYGDEHFLRTLYYDLELEQESATSKLAEELSLLEPFGVGNEEPVFLFRNFVPDRIVKMGEGEHLKMVSGTWEAVWFYADAAPVPGREYTLAATLSLNEFRGRKSLQAVALHVGESKREDRSLQYLRSFPGELLAYREFLLREKKMCRILSREELAGRLRGNLFGQAVLVGSEVGNMIVKAEQLSLGEPDGNSLENAAVHEAAPLGYELVLLGAFRKLAEYPDAAVCFDEGVQQLYAAEAERYFFQEERFPYYKNCFLKIHGQGFLTVRQLLQAACGEGQQEKAWFALNILSELGLLVLKKNGKIYINYKEKEGELKDSRFYLALRDVCGKGV